MQEVPDIRQKIFRKIKYIKNFTGETFAKKEYTEFSRNCSLVKISTISYYITKKFIDLLLGPSGLKTIPMTGANEPIPFGTTEHKSVV